MKVIEKLFKIAGDYQPNRQVLYALYKMAEYIENEIIENDALPKYELMMKEHREGKTTFTQTYEIVKIAQNQWGNARGYSQDVAWEIAQTMDADVYENEVSILGFEVLENEMKQYIDIA